MYLIQEERHLKDAIAFAYSIGLNIAPKAKAEVGGEDIEVVVEKNMTDVKCEADRHVPAGVSPDDN